MKTTAIKSRLTLVATLLLSSPCIAGLTEDGSAFTGYYRILEQTPECGFIAAQFYQPEVDTLTVQGTPQGLIVDGNLIQVSVQDLSKLPPGTNGADAGYLSSSIFKSIFVLNDVPPGSATLIEEYLLQPGGMLLKISSNSDPSKILSPAYSVCHYQKI